MRVLRSTLLILSTTCVLACTEAQLYRDVTSAARQYSIRQPHVRAVATDVPGDVLFACLASCLEEQGVQWVAVDREAGIVSWCDIGGSFQPLEPEGPPSETAGFDRVSTRNWSGAVFANALVWERDDEAGISLLAAGRTSSFETRQLSDGTYERALLGAVERRLANLRTGRWRPSRELPTGLPPRAAGGGYQTSFKSYFREFSLPSGSQIRSVGAREQLPASAERLWSALVLVAAQKGFVAGVSSEEFVIAFVTGALVPSEDPLGEPTRTEVILAAAVESLDAETSIVAVALLDPDDLAARPLISPSPYQGADAAILASSATREELAASIAVSSLWMELGTQAFHAERWGDKVFRRSGFNPPLAE